MKEDIIILAYGGTSHELAEIAHEQYTVIGFLDDLKTGPEILGTLQDIERYKSIKLASGLGSFRSMQRRQTILKDIDLDSFVNIIAQDSRVYRTVRFGKGVSVFPHTVVASNAVIGNHVLLYHNCVLSHDITIKDYTIISNSVTLSGGVSIGENVYVGAGATILEGISIGDNCIIAAGATVLSSVENNKIYVSLDKVYDNHYIRC